MRLDLHVHSTHSQDGTVSPKEILERCREIGLDGCAITDHNSIDGSLEACRIASEVGLIAVRGVEISSSEGHVLAYGISSLVPRGLPLEETIRRVHDLDGIAVAAHPTRFGSGIGIDRVANMGFDAVEVLNGGSSRRGNRIASGLAGNHRLPVTGGSDAHKSVEIGRAVTVVDDVSCEKDVLKAVTEGRARVEGRSRNCIVGIMHTAEATFDWARRGFRRI